MNEEKRILRCIENFAGLFPVLVIDNHSTDTTEALVEKSGHRSIKIRNPGFSETPEVMDPLQAACDTDYVLIASVSEFVPLALLKKYAEVANSESHDVVRAFRVSITAGLPIPISGRPTRRFAGDMRFFRKGSVDYTGNQVHGLGKIVAPSERVLSVVTDESLHFYQFRDYDCSHTELKHRTYNDVLARQRFDSGVRFSWFRMLFASTKLFLNSYIRFGSIRFGMPGFIHSFYRWQMEIGIWLRIWEWQHDLIRPQVIERNSELRQRLEKEFLDACKTLPEPNIAEQR